MAAGFRPSQWSKPLLTSMEVSSSAPGATPGRGQSQSTLYYFDAAFRVEHFQNLRHTEHPIQSGSSIVDHAYLTPARVALEIGMSDSMDRYSQGVYTSDKSKSVAAFNTFLDIQAKRVPVTLNTRLKKYVNMLVEDVRASDDNSTLHGLKATIYFYELIVGTVTSSPTNSDSGSSARPDQTNVNNEGTKQPRQLTDSEIQKLRSLDPQPRKTTGPI